MTRTATIVRNPSTDAGTFGVLTLDDGWTCHTGELPWADNAPRVSCIPDGQYLATEFMSPRLGTRVLLLQDVPGRFDIEGHAANWMGDEAKGLRCELLGCIAFGEEQGVIGGQEGLINSLEALHELLRRLAGEPVLLTISWASPVGEPRGEEVAA